MAASFRRSKARQREPEHSSWNGYGCPSVYWPKLPEVKPRVGVRGPRIVIWGLWTTLPHTLLARADDAIE